MRTIMVCATLLLCGMVAVADGTSTGVQWPGWRVSTSEEPDTPGYPITNMLDGDPHSAWVYSKPWQNYYNGSNTPDPEEVKNFQHGVGAYIMIDTDHFPNEDQCFTVDGIGIINGYAKSSRTYWRNNRIRKIMISGYGEGDLHQTYDLAETRELQHLAIPRHAYRYLQIKIESVNAGADDDLCISELVLYDHGRPIPWHMTRALLYNASNGCGCGGGPGFTLMTRDGQTIEYPGIGLTEFVGVAPRPDSTLALLCSEHVIFLYDFATAQIKSKYPYTGKPISLGWIDTRHALLQVEDAKGKNHWYQLTCGEKNHWVLIHAPDKEPKYLPGVKQPNYGA